MAFAKKEWKGRIVEFPGRRRLKGTGITDVYDIARNEGAITQEGDAFSAANMNDLEGRIEGGLLEKVNKSDVLQTLEQVSANTDSNKIAGANALRELNNKCENERLLISVQTVTITAGPNASAAKIIPLPSDYKQIIARIPIAQGSGGSWAAPITFKIDGGYVYMNNLHSSVTVTQTVGVIILYK